MRELPQSTGIDILANLAWRVISRGDTNRRFKQVYGTLPVLRSVMAAVNVRLAGGFGRLTCSGIESTVSWLKSLQIPNSKTSVWTWAIYGVLLENWFAIQACIENYCQ